MARPKKADAEYLRIAAALRERIEQGEFVPGSLIPSEGRIAAEYSVARGTARSALQQLGPELVEVVPGRGRVVRSKSDALPAAGRRYRLIAAKYQLAIQQGEYRAGDYLPSEATIAQTEGVARSTVQAAMKELENAGHVKAVQGKGRIVL